MPHPRRPRRTAPHPRALPSLVALAVVVPLLVLAPGCGRVIVPPTLADEPPPPHPTGFAPQLVERYHILDKRGEPDGSLRLVPRYRGLRYLPGASSVAGYEGWGVLEVPRSSSNDTNWLELTLARRARVAVVAPQTLGWLRGWRRAADVGEGRVFVRDVGAGPLRLGPPGDGNEAYRVLLAEADGTPTPEPPLPAGIAAADRPQPNARCPGWLHDLYQAPGPDGALYETWHPQIDPVYWCAFTHEHGADPSLVGYAPAFRYVADRNALQPEQHEGFKGYAIPDVTSSDGRVVDWYVSIHSTTSNLHRACARHHTVVIAVLDAATHELLAQLSFKGDFGATRANQDDHPLIQATFTTCPDQRAIANETTREKRLRVANQPGMENGGYETWRGALAPSLGMSVPWGPGLILDIRDPMTACDTLRCAGAIATGSQGTLRTLRFTGLRLRYDTEAVVDLDAYDGALDGAFYTDPYGREARAPDAPDAVWQYLKPGLDVDIDGHFATEDAWRGLYVRDVHPVDLELEGALADN